MMSTFLADKKLLDNIFDFEMFRLEAYQCISA
jgi:hypothetical protein